MRGREGRRKMTGMEKERRDNGKISTAFQ